MLLHSLKTRWGVLPKAVSLVANGLIELRYRIWPAKKGKLAEQLIADPVTNLVYQVFISKRGEVGIRVWGDSLTHGSGELRFDKSGQHVASRFPIFQLSVQRKL